MADLDRKTARFVAALATGQRIEEAAKQAGVSESTAYRRLRDPLVRERVAELQREALERATAALVTLAVAAVAALGELLSCPAQSVRLGAARAVLELGTRLRETETIEARLTALEQAQAQGLRRVG